MASTSRLELVPKLHAGGRILDININGVALAERIRNHEGKCDRVSPLGWIAGSFARFLLQEPPDLPGQRTSLLVCPLCGDLGCGAVSALISLDGDLLHWREMGIATDRSGPDEGPWLFHRITSFTFSWSQYREVLTSARGGLLNRSS